MPAPGGDLPARRLDRGIEDLAAALRGRPGLGERRKLVRTLGIDAGAHLLPLGERMREEAERHEQEADDRRAEQQGTRERKFPLRARRDE